MRSVASVLEGDEGHTLAFGPVPSRRLGRSVGINHIPPKICTYACVYCQLGRTYCLHVDRRAFHPPDDVLRAVQNRIAAAGKAGEAIDFLTFVPDGEPSLDINLGTMIDRVRPLGAKIAVISNASLIWDPGVRRDLAKADWVSLSVDAADEEPWRRVNRPHRSLHLKAIQDGILEFAEVFEGKLVTETMLVCGLNDDAPTLEKVAAFISEVKPATAYLSIPTRPPAEKWVQVPEPNTMITAYKILADQVGHVEFLTAYEGDDFASTGSVEEAILSTTSVHPMREEAVQQLLTRTGEDWSVVRKLLGQGLLIELLHRGHKFYMRTLPGR